jgi:hypothetical protein
MALSGATLLVWPVRDAPATGRGPAAYWEQPHLTLEPEPDVGPILVQLSYEIRESDEPAFLAAMDRVRRSRQRTGAYRWQLYRDGETSGRFVEAYLVPSWEEHLRQHNGRLTESDAVAEQEAVAFSGSTPEVHHLFPTWRR